MDFAFSFFCCRPPQTAEQSDMISSDSRRNKAQDFRPTARFLGPVAVFLQRGAGVPAFDHAMAQVQIRRIWYNCYQFNFYPQFYFLICFCGA